MCVCLLALTSIRGWYNLYSQWVCHFFLPAYLPPFPSLLPFPCLFLLHTSFPLTPSFLPISLSLSLHPSLLSPSLLPPFPSIPYSLSLSQSVVGEYNNPEAEQLVLWIRDHTPQTAVFAGTMPTMATVLLTTGRPVVNHPHYENAGLRSVCVCVCLSLSLSLSVCLSVCVFVCVSMYLSLCTCMSVCQCVCVSA